jgi:hypothetical protein
VKRKEHKVSLSDPSNQNDGYVGKREDNAQWRKDRSARKYRARCMSRVRRGVLVVALLQYRRAKSHGEIVEREKRAVLVGGV